MTIKQLFKGKNKVLLKDFIFSKFEINIRHIADIDAGTITHNPVGLYKAYDSDKQSFFIALDYDTNIQSLLDFLTQHDIPWLLEHNMSGAKDIKWITFYDYEKIHFSKE